MSRLLKLLLFVVVNILGFSSTAIVYGTTLITGVFTKMERDEAYQTWETLFSTTGLIWLLCAVFSLAYFFIEGTMRFVFLWAAFVVPLLYGFSVVYL